MPALEEPKVKNRPQTAEAERTVEAPTEADPLYRILKPCTHKGFTPPPKPPARKPGEPVPPPVPPTLVRRSEFTPLLDFTRPNARGEWPYGKDLTTTMIETVKRQETDAIILRLLRLKCIEPYISIE